MATISKTQIFIRGFPSSMTERDIKDEFKKFGKIKEVIMKNGFAFVEYVDSEDAEKATIRMNGKELQGRQLYVDAARLNRKRDDMRRNGYSR